MDFDGAYQLIVANPITSTLVLGGAAATARYFKPILRAGRAAIIRRINQAWQDHSDECNVEERVRKTTEQLCSTTRFPLPQSYVEGHVRKHVSKPPDPA